MLLPGGAGQGYGVLQIGGDDVERDRLGAPAEVSVAGVNDDAVRHRLLLVEQRLDVDDLRHGTEGNGDARGAAFHLPRPPEARRRLAAQPLRMIPLEIADGHALADGGGVLGTK